MYKRKYETIYKRIQTVRTCPSFHENRSCFKSQSSSGSVQASKINMCRLKKTCNNSWETSRRRLPRTYRRRLPRTSRRRLPHMFLQQKCTYDIRRRLPHICRRSLPFTVRRRLPQAKIALYPKSKHANMFQAKIASGEDCLQTLQAKFASHIQAKVASHIRRSLPQAKFASQFALTKHANIS